MYRPPLPLVLLRALLLPRMSFVLLLAALPLVHLLLLLPLVLLPVLLLLLLVPLLLLLLLSAFEAFWSAVRSSCSSSSW